MTNPNNIEPKILDRVRALMAKAEATDYPAEAETYAAKAAELMARYGVEQAMLADSDPTKDPIEHVTIVLPDPYAETKAVLLNEIAGQMSCTVLYNHQNKTAKLYGHRSDMERVEFLYTSLLLQAFRMVRNVRPEYRYQGGVRSYRRSWLLGFATRIKTRLAAATKQAVQDSTRTGAELVLVSRRKRVAVQFHQENPTVSNRNIRAGNNHGYADGHAAANQADIGQARVGGRRVALGQ